MYWPSFDFSWGPKSSNKPASEEPKKVEEAEEVKEEGKNPADSSEAQTLQKMITYLSSNDAVDKMADLDTILKESEYVLLMQDKDGKTPLHHAVINKVDPKIVKRLLEHTPKDIHAIDNKKKTVFHYIAKDNQNMNILSLFAEAAIGDAKSIPIEIKLNDYYFATGATAKGDKWTFRQILNEDIKRIEMMIKNPKNIPLENFEITSTLKRARDKMQRLYKHGRSEYPPPNRKKGGKRKTQKRRRSLSSNTLKIKKQKAKLKKKNKSIRSYRLFTKSKTYKKK